VQIARRLIQYILHYISQFEEIDTVILSCSF